MTATEAGLDDARLKKLKQICGEAERALRAALEAEFGEHAPAFYNIGVFILAGWALDSPDAKRAPDVIAKVWASMGVPFTIEAKRIQ